MRVLIVPDKFKGTLSAAEAAQAMAAGWARGRPQDRLTLVPMSDGGDGFGSIINRLIRGRAQRLRTVDPAHQPLQASWWWHQTSRTAVIESAAVIGLALLPPGRFHPFNLDTFGLGAVFRAAAGKGAQRCLVGIGGSATNDAGFGLARALGWVFEDQQGKPIQVWTDLPRLHWVRKPKKRRWFKEVRVAVDVSNPLLGVRGATRVYGPQKGLREEDFEIAERCLRRLKTVVREALGVDWSRTPGAGAAGGLGFGLQTFLGAKLEPGFELFAQYADLEKHFAESDLVLTGEGSIDRSTAMGKGVGQIAQMARERELRCIGLAGIADTDCQSAFTAVHALTTLTSKKKAQEAPGLWLERLAERTARAVRDQGGT